MPRVTDTLEQLLHQHRCLLVRGPAGTGKTREISVVAQRASKLGWSILIFKEGWISAPPEWPEDLPHRDILVILDDLHHSCTPGTKPQHPKAAEWHGEEPSMSFQDGLHEYLSFLESPGEKEVRIIGTTRIENEQWEKLDFERHPVWKRFHCIDLPPLTDTALNNLLTHYASESGVSLRSSRNLVQNSDGMPRTLLLNVDRAKLLDYGLDPNYWINTADGTWQEVYEELARKESHTPTLYDAAHLLQQWNIPLYTPVLISLAARLQTNNVFSYHIRRWQLIRALRKLATIGSFWKLENDLVILREGLVEGKNKLPDSIEHFDTVRSVFLPWALKYRKPSLVAFAHTALDKLDRAAVSQAANELFRIADTLLIDGTQRYWAHILRGELNLSLEKPQLAVQDFLHATKLQPTSSTARSSLGLAYLESDDRQAIQALTEAISLSESPANLYHARGHAHANFGETNLAIKDFRKAAELEPDSYYHYKCKGEAYIHAGSYEQAINDITHFIDNETPDAAAFYLRGKAFQYSLQYEKAKQDYTSALGIDAEHIPARHARAYCNYHLGRNQEAIADASRIIEMQPDYAEAFHVRAHAFENLGNLASALEDLSTAVELVPLDSDVCQ